MMRLRDVYVVLLILGLGLSPGAQAGSPSGYADTIREWRQNREARLQEPYGWLSLAGLHWLEEGDNAFGSDPSLPIPLPPKSAPPNAGTFVLKGNVVTLVPAKDSKIFVNAEPVSEKVILRSDKDGQKADEIRLGRLKVYVIHRSKGFGIRVKDPEVATRRKFRGLSWYEIDDSYRVKGRFLPTKPPKKVKVPNIIGGEDEVESPGTIEFALSGKQHRLLALDAGENLFVIFKDETNHKGTYPSGRFLYTKKPEGNSVTIDFNKAYNPPCAYTPYATCPLPPAGNEVSVKIRAGEKFSGHH